MKKTILSYNWPEYFNAVEKNLGRNRLSGRIELLRRAHHLFNAYPNFYTMDYDDRRRIGGLIEVEGNVNWLSFGSMNGAGKFKGKIKDNNVALSDALDHIPLTGEVTYNQYTSYCQTFLKAFPNGGGGISTCTRLLAMKRPDYFVCYDRENKLGFVKHYNVNIYKPDFQKYWDKIIAPSLDTEWWNTTSLKDPVQSSVWKCRIAFLDAMLYHF